MNQFIYLLILLLAIAFLLRVDFIFYIIYVCLGLFAWARFYTPYALRGVTAERRYPKRAFWGEIVEVTVRLTNSRRLPLPWLQLAESVALELKMGEPLSEVVVLRGRETAEFTYRVRAKRRGYYRLGPLFLSTSDLFGFFEPRFLTAGVDYLTVYPRITQLTHLGLPSRLPFGTVASTQRLFEDPARPFGVRDYRSGDSLRQINWKASGHTRHLLVKTYQPAISLETAVLLNLNSHDFQRQERGYYIEWAIEVAASIAAHLADQRQAVGLLTNGRDPLQTEGELAFDTTSGRLINSASDSGPPPTIPPRSGRAHLMKVLERLARIEAAEHDFLRWAPNVCHHLNWGVTLIAITPRGDEATCHMLHQLARAGLNPVLIVCQPTANFGLLRERARRLGFKAYLAAAAEDLAPWRV